MIRAHTNIGDLVYLPSEVLLRGGEGFIKTTQPVNVIYLGERSVEIKVLYQGASWWVPKQRVYNVRLKHGH